MAIWRHSSQGSNRDQPLPPLCLTQVIGAGGGGTPSDPSEELPKELVEAFQGVSWPVMPLRMAPGELRSAWASGSDERMRQTAPGELRSAWASLSPKEFLKGSELTAAELGAAFKHTSQGSNMLHPSCPWCKGHRPGAAGVEGPGSGDLSGRVMLLLGGGIIAAPKRRMRLFLKSAANLPRQSLGEAYCLPLALPL